MSDPCSEVPANAQGECGEDQVAGCFLNEEAPPQFHFFHRTTYFFVEWCIFITRPRNVRAGEFSIKLLIDKGL